MVTKKKKKTTKRKPRRKQAEAAWDRVFKVMSSPVLATALDLIFKEVRRTSKRR